MTNIIKTQETVWRRFPPWFLSFFFSVFRRPFSLMARLYRNFRCQKVGQDLKLLPLILPEKDSIPESPAVKSSSTFLRPVMSILRRLQIPRKFSFFFFSKILTFDAWCFLMILEPNITNTWVVSLWIDRYNLRIVFCFLRTNEMLLPLFSYTRYMSTILWRNTMELRLFSLPIFLIVVLEDVVN